LNRIAELRKKNGLTQTQLAGMMLVDQTAVSLWENEKALPDVQKLVKLADIFEVSLDYLVGRSGSNLYSPEPREKEAPGIREPAGLSEDEVKILREFIAYLGRSI